MARRKGTFWQREKGPLTYFGGVVERVVLDNTSLAVKQVLAGRDRAETEAFAAFRGLERQVDRGSKGDGPPATQTGYGLWGYPFNRTS